MKMLSQIDKNDKNGLNRYKDLLRHRLRKYGYRLLSYAPYLEGKRNLKRSEKFSGKGYRLIEIQSCRVVAGQDFSLSLKQVENFWLEEYIRRRRQRSREKQRQRELRGVHHYG